MGAEACKITIGGITRNITDPGDKEAIKQIFDKHHGDAFLLKRVGEIADSGMSFLVPAYQRGYRWGKEEVNALFDDLLEFQNERECEYYCLQPLVVRKASLSGTEKSLEGIVFPESEANASEKAPNRIYELIDGQQRLTTIWLLLFVLNGKNTPNYQLRYEFLRNVDLNFINAAKELLENKCRKLKKRAESFLKTLEEKAVFLWYEIAEKQGLSEKSEKIFRQINKGKIELTNAELFKAMLLNDELAKTPQEKREQEIIAFEWDKIEQSLADDDFWFFICGDGTDDKTRIDYIFDIYADELKEAKWFDNGKERYSFLAVQAHLKSNGSPSFSNVKKVWDQIVFIHDKFRSYYSHRAIYHLFGFLVAVSGKGWRGAEAMASEVIAECGNKGLGETEESLKRRVAKLFKEDGKGGKPIRLDDLNYGDAKLFEFLLFSNIWPYLKSESGRFPFKSFHLGEWDIEHINPQQANEDIDGITDGKTALAIWDYMHDSHSDRLASLERPKDGDAAIKVLKDNWSKWKECLQDGDDKITNLCLLNRGINRGYKNALFVEKRSKIIQADEKGEFIPVATKAVFMKYFSDCPKQFAVWDEADELGYANHLGQIAEELAKW